MADVVRLPGTKLGMRDLLQKIMDDEDAVGFAGGVYRRNGDLVPVISNEEMTRERLTYVAAVINQIALEDSDE